MTVTATARSAAQSYKDAFDVQDLALMASLSATLATEAAISGHTVSITAEGFVQFTINGASEMLGSDNA